MRLEALLGSIGLASVAKVAASGMEELPHGLAPAVRSNVVDFARLDVDGSEVAVVEVPEGVRTATILRTLESVGSACGCGAMAYFDSLSKHMRERLLDERVPFAVADGQFFIPGAMMLAPMSASPATPSPRRLSPTAMASLAWFVNRNAPANPQELADALKMSKASASRACEALVAVGVLSKRMVGEKRHRASYEVKGGAGLATSSLRAFGNPVRYEVFVDAERAAGLLLCGESALAERSLLAAPRVPIFAASPEEGRALEPYARDVEALACPAKVKVLAYDPRPLSDGGVVDPFTMLNTIDDAGDERVRLALDEALEGCSWYESQA